MPGVWTSFAHELETTGLHQSVAETGGYQRRKPPIVRTRYHFVVFVAQQF